jgi:hypothetical protein
VKQFFVGQRVCDEHEGHDHAGGLGVEGHGGDPAAPYVGGRSLKWLKVKVRNYRVKERGWE